MFIDSVTLTLRAGSGGNGTVAWRREKFIPKGGPVGGNGGKGGSILLQTDTHTLSLEGLRNHRIIAAENGMPGGGNLCQGRTGKDLTLKIPCGTLVKDAKTGTVLFDLTEEGKTQLICQGGRGGKGNACFKSPTNQAPTTYTPGKAGESVDIELELKLIADVGLVGMPNAGKSTLMRQITHVPVKIGAYPFTTLVPNLGYVRFEDFTRVLVADIPGIIEYAHQNKGLGISFLRHIERSSALVYVVDISGIEGRDPYADLLVLQSELQEYQPELLKKPHLIALNKIDADEAQEQIASFRAKYRGDPSRLFEISAKNGDGLDALIGAMDRLVRT